MTVQSSELSRRALLQFGVFLGVALSVPALGAEPPVGFTTSQAGIVTEVAEIIIPATDTGGATAAGVPAFIEKMVTQWFSADERANFLASLQAFGDGALARFGKTFTSLSPEQKSQWYAEQLSIAEKLPQGGAGNGPPPRTPFAAMMKSLTICGFYTSELGATQELHSEMMFDHVDGCAPVNAGDRADTFQILPIMFSAY